MSSVALYDKDFYAWAKEQALLLKQKAYDKLDAKHLFEEIEDMVNRYADELESRLEVLLMHLLKWKFQPNLQSRSWQLTIKEQRHKIEKRLKKMPSLVSKLDELFLDAYEGAIIEAEKETGLDESAFPKKCPWTIQEVLSIDFLPNN